MNFKIIFLALVISLNFIPQFTFAASAEKDDVGPDLDDHVLTKKEKENITGNPQVSLQQLRLEMLDTRANAKQPPAGAGKVPGMGQQNPPEAYTTPRRSRRWIRKGGSKVTQPTDQSYEESYDSGYRSDDESDQTAAGAGTGY